MSLRVMTWVLDHSDTKLGDRLTLLALAEYAHDDGTKAFPTVETLATKTRLNRRTVQRTLRKLEEDGVIAKTGATAYGANIYTVICPLNGGGNMSPPGAALSAEGAASDPSRGGGAPPDPLGPVKDPSEPHVSARAQVRAAWEAAPGAVRHKAPYYSDGKVVSAIDRAVKRHGIEDVVAAIELYAEITRSPDYRWDWRWPLREFLERGVDRFVPEADPKTAWRVGRNGKSKLTDQERAELQVYNKA